MDKLKDYLTKNATFLGNDLPSKKVWVNVATQINVNENAAYNSKPTKNYTSIILLAAKYTVAACVIALAGFGGWSLLKPKNDFTNNYVTIEPKNKVFVDTEYAAPKTTDTPFTMLHNVANNIIDNLSQDNDESTPKKITVEQTNIDANNIGFVQVKNVDSQFQQIINIQKNKINNTPLFAEKPTYFKDFVVAYKQMEKDEKNLKKDMLAIGFTNELLEQLINVNQQKLNLLKLLQTEINKTNIRFKQNRYLIDTAKAYFIQI